MKESVTKFDLEAAFKALDEMDVPASEKGIKANRPALTEIFSRKSKFESLFEEYYDIGSVVELDSAKEAREAEIAKAKLARIEKIVDLEAESPEDLLTTYVGKYIIQCPQCMTLFYKDKEDVIESEDDPTNVNVGEACQHCGHESGYTLIGKVGEAEADEMEEPTLDTEIPAEPVAEEEPVEDTSEESTEDSVEEPAEEADDLDIALDAIDLEDETVEEDDKKEESFVAHEGEALVEEIKDDDLDAKLKAHGYYIDYLRAMISQDEKALEKADNEQVKAAIQRRIDAFKADLEAALPSEVRDDLASDDLPTPEEVVEEVAEEVADEVVEEDGEKQEESYIMTVGGTLTEELHEEAELEVSAEEFEKLIKEPEFKQPISDTAVRAMLNSEKASDETEDVNESVSLEENIFTDIIDKLKTRANKAEWILNTAKKDYNTVKVDNGGKILPDEANQKFGTFVVYCFKDRLSTGKKITMAPRADNPNLVPGREPEAKKKYSDAENIAKGWSKISGNGPAMIFMAKALSDSEKSFLCQFFGGELDSRTDQLENWVKDIRNSLSGAKILAKGKPGQPDVTELTTTELKPGMKVDLGEHGVLEIAEIKQSMFSSDKVVSFKGISEPFKAAANYKFKVVSASITTESVNTFGSSVEQLQESSLEKLISDSLVEAYGNVAGYRLNSWECLNEQLTVNGTIYFTSGNTRKTTYTFSEALVEDKKVTLKGLNEKLGLDKQFVLTGHVDEAKTLITESFGYNKK